MRILKNLMQSVIKGIFIGYSKSSKAYKVYNLIPKIVMESTNVVINDEQCIEDHSEVIQSIQDKPIEV